jgi:hypothetical protein
MRNFKALALLAFLFYFSQSRAQICCDSTITYLCSGFDEVDYDSTRIEYTYSASGKLMFVRKYGLQLYSCCVQDSVWRPVSSTDYRYHADGNIAEIVSYSQYEGSFIYFNGSHRYYSFDSSGRLLEATDSSYSTGSSSGTKNYYTRDSSGNIVQHISQNLSNNIWTNYVRKDFVIGITNKDSVVVTYNWQGSWQNQNMIEYFYNSGGKDSTIIYSSWNTASWLYTNLYDYFYDGSLRDSIVVGFRFNAATLNWDSLSRTSYQYDSLGLLHIILTESFQISGWIPDRKIEYTYNQWGKETYFEDSRYYQGIGWERVSWYYTTYDSLGQKTETYSSCYGCGHSSSSYRYNYGLLTKYSHENYSHGGVGGGEDCDIFYYKIYGDSMICSGDTALLHVSPGYSYLWSNGLNSDSIYVTESAYYSCILTDSTGRTFITPKFYLIVNNGVSATHKPDTIINLCSNNKLILQEVPDAGNSYQWLRNDTAITTLGVGNALYYKYGSQWLPGEYRCVVKNACGIDTSSLIIVNAIHIAPAQIVTVGNTTFCSGDSVLLIANAGPYTYSWNYANSTDDSLLFVSTGWWGTKNFSLTITDTNSCSSTTTQSIRVLNNPASPIIYIDGNQLFTNWNIYQWFFNGNPISSGTGAPLIALDTGIYTITNYNLDSSCSKTLSFYFAPGQLSANASTSILSICEGGSTILGVSGNTATGGSPPYSYRWFPDSLFSSISIPNPTVYPISSGYVYLEVSDSAGNTALDSAYLIVKPVPTKPVIDTVSTVFCFNARMSNQLHPKNDTCGAYTFLWYESGNPSVLYTGCYFTVLHTGDYFVAKRNSGGCITYSDTIHITVIGSSASAPAPQVSGTAVACGGQGVQLHYAQLPYPINWFYNNQPVGNPGDTTILSLGTGTYLITYIDSNQCTIYSNSVFVHDSTLAVTLSLPGGPDPCLGDTILLIANTADSTASFTWYDSAGLIPGQTNDSIYISSSGYYYCDASGLCSGSASIGITFSPPPTISAFQQGNILTASTPNQFLGWFRNDTLINTNLITQINGAGVYRGVAVNSSCSDTAEVIFNIYCSLTFTVDSIINPSCIGCANGAIYFSCNNNGFPYSVNIYPSAGILHQGYYDSLPAGQYYISVVDSINCTSGDSAILPGIPNSIQQYKLEHLRIFPVPAVDLIKLEWNMNDHIEFVELFDVNGSKLYSTHVKDKFSLELNIKNLAPGVFTFRFTIADRYYFRRWNKSE